jgi:protein-S-isoprenylcysteine O-methyltransferase Ste14
MAIDSLTNPDATVSATRWLSPWAAAYRAVGYLGLVSVFAALVYGFRFDASAPAINILWDVLLYAAFIAPHLAMTRPWYKRLVTGNPAGSPGERRAYILFTMITWLAVLALHLPMPGFQFHWPVALADAIPFVGVAGVLVSFLLLNEGASVAMLDGMLGVPGAVKAYSHGADTPLFTEGQYAQVRHPMYRAALLAGLAGLLVHPNLAQMLWSAMIGGTLVAFIPVEEAQLIAARGDDYRRYRERTPWRLFRGIW